MDFQDNNNHSAVRTLARKSLKKSKLRNLFSGVIIALSTCLLVTVAIVGFNSSADFQYKSTHHGVYQEVDSNTLFALQALPEVEGIGVSAPVGIVHEDEVTMSIQYSDKNTLILSGMEVENITMPGKANEIVIPEIYLEKTGQNKKIGDTISIRFRNHITKEMQTAEFIICDFLDNGDAAQAQTTLMAIVSKAFYDADVNLYAQNPNVAVRIAMSEEFTPPLLKEKVVAIAASVGIEKDSVSINTTYIDGVNITPETTMAVIVVALVVLVACILVIYSIFYVAVVGKVKEYGQLRTIGTTAKQIKRIIAIEGGLLCLVFIPIGLVIGVILAYVIFPNGWQMGADILLALAMCIITFLAVRLALHKPMKLAATISPIEAVRFNAYQSDSHKDKKSVRHLSPARLGMINLRRNRKRTILTMLSLAFSGVLFIAAANVMSTCDPALRAKQAFKNDGEYRIDFNDDLYSPTYNLNHIQINNPLTAELKEQILSIDGIDGVVIERDILMDIALPLGEKESYAIENIRKQNLESYQKFSRDGTLDYGKLNHPKTILVNETDYERKQGRVYHEGDQIKVTIFDGEEMVEQELIVGGVMDNPDIGNTFLMTDEMMDELVTINCTSSFEFLSKQGYSTAAEQELKALVKENEALEMSTLHALTLEMKTMFQMMTIGIYIFTGFITFFGLINLINTSITNILARRQEIGVLQAVGLTNKQLKKMVSAEGLFFAGGTILFSAIFGSVLGYMVCNVLQKNGGTFIVYHFPFIPILLLIVAMVLMELFLSKMSSKLLGKQSLIERLREADC